MIKFLQVFTEQFKLSFQNWEIDIILIKLSHKLWFTFIVLLTSSFSNSSWSCRYTPYWYDKILIYIHMKFYQCLLFGELLFSSNTQVTAKESSCSHKGLILYVGYDLLDFIFPNILSLSFLYEGLPCASHVFVPDCVCYIYVQDQVRPLYMQLYVCWFCGVNPHCPFGAFIYCA